MDDKKVHHSLLGPDVLHFLDIFSQKVIKHHPSSPLPPSPPTQLYPSTAHFSTWLTPTFRIFLFNQVHLFRFDDGHGTFYTLACSGLNYKYLKYNLNLAWGNTHTKSHKRKKNRDKVLTSHPKVREEGREHPQTDGWTGGQSEPAQTCSMMHTF